jgi:hypothetical protein
MRCSQRVLAIALALGPSASAGHTSLAKGYSRHGCSTESHVVGRDRCRHFGDWATTPGAAALTFDLGLVGERVADTNAIGSRVRMLVGTGAFYAGGEVDLAHAIDRPATLYATRAVAGLREPLGIATFAAELAGGGHWGAIDAELELEARGRVDVWLTRVLTIGGAAGIDVLDRHDMSVVVSFGVHSRSMDGQ